MGVITLRLINVGRKRTRLDIEYAVEIIVEIAVRETGIPITLHARGVVTLFLALL